MKKFIPVKTEKEVISIRLESELLKTVDAAAEQAEISRLAKDRDDEKAILQGSFYDRIRALMIGQKVAKAEGFKSGTLLTEENLKEVANYNLRKMSIADDAVMTQIEELIETLNQAEKELQENLSIFSSEKDLEIKELFSSVPRSSIIKRSHPKRCSIDVCGSVPSFWNACCFKRSNSWNAVR